jgi:hypothetical protein
MPETFTRILDDIADEGRGRMRPFPASEIHALAHRLSARRRRIAATTAGVVALAVSVGLVLTTGVVNGSGPGPVGPDGHPSPDVPGRSSSPRTGLFLTAAELPHEDVLKWIIEPVYTPPANDLAGYRPTICGRTSKAAGGVPTSVVLNQIRTEAAGVSVYGGETIYTFATPEAAASDYAGLIPIPGRCEASPAGYGFTSGTGTQTGSVAGGFSWSQTVTGPGVETDHFIVAHRGATIMVLEYVERWKQGQQRPVFDATGDQQALEAMARLLG